MSPQAYFNNPQENFTEMPSAKMQACHYIWNRRHFGSGCVLDTSPIAVINYPNKSHVTSSSQSMTGKTCQLEQEIPCHTKSSARKQKAMNAILFAFFLFFSVWDPSLSMELPTFSVDLPTSNKLI